MDSWTRGVSCSYVVLLDKRSRIFGMKKRCPNLQSFFRQCRKKCKCTHTADHKLCSQAFPYQPTFRCFFNARHLGTWQRPVCYKVPDSHLTFKADPDGFCAFLYIFPPFFKCRIWERERERDNITNFIYIYIYIYVMRILCCTSHSIFLDYACRIK